MVDKFILEAVKDASKEHKDIPNYDKLCEEHAEKVEAFIIEMLHTSRPAKQKEPEGMWMMTQDPELPKELIEELKEKQRGKGLYLRNKPIMIDSNKFESGHCIVFEGITGAGMSSAIHEHAVKEIAEELSKRGCKEVRIKKDE